MCIHDEKRTWFGENATEMVKTPGRFAFKKPLEYLSRIACKHAYTIYSNSFGIMEVGPGFDGPTIAGLVILPAEANCPKGQDAKPAAYVLNKDMVAGLPGDSSQHNLSNTWEFPLAVRKSRQSPCKSLPETNRMCQFADTLLDFAVWI